MTDEVKAISLLDAKIEDATEDLAKAQAKLDSLLLQKQNESKIDSVKVGDTVTVEYGRAPNRRDVTGTVVGVREADGKVSKLFAIQTGEGVDVQIIKAYAADLKV